MAMRSRKWAYVAGIILVVSAVAAIAIYYSLPHSAPEQLRRARNIEARVNPVLQQLAAQSDENSRKKLESLRRSVTSAYQRVSQKYPATPEADEADHRLLQIADENSTDTTARLRLIDAFLKEHPNSRFNPDVKWRAAELLQKDKRYLEAIKRFEQFAKDYPNHERSAEALYRAASIYEEIREFQRAVEAYRRVVKEYPTSKFADEAQFRVGNLLAEKMEKKSEAEKEFAKLEKDYPKSRFAQAAAGERRKLSSESAGDKREEARAEYYGGVREDDALASLSLEIYSPEMQRLREQPIRILREDVVAHVSPGDHLLTGSSRMLLAADAPVSGPVIVQLAEPLNIEYIKRGSRELTFNRAGNFVFVSLGADAITSGSTETLEITYSGRNSKDWGGTIITTSSTFLVGYTWIPVFGPGQTFPAEIQIEVPKGYYAISQGRLSGPTGKDPVLFRYSQSEPVYFYALVAGPYDVQQSVFERTVDNRPTSTVLMTCFRDDAGSETSRAYLHEIPSILRFFEKHLGRYPYEKLAVTQIDHFPGGLGTPGVILLGPKAFEKQGVPAEFLAHEIAHAWFGNELKLDLGSDSIPWLSEGFAQYWDALYHEWKQGHRAFVQHMREMAENYYMCVSVLQDRPIRQSVISDPTYSSLTYDKGAFVLHALRGIIGDEKFFAMMHKYAVANREKLVTLSGFQRAAEEAYGAPLAWFFSEWLDRAGIPRYRLNSAVEQTTASGHAVQVGIEQPGDLYRMPVEIEVETAGAPVRSRVEVADKLTTVVIATKDAPRKAVLDPDYWILKHPRNAEWEKEVTK